KETRHWAPWSTPFRAFEARAEHHGILEQGTSTRIAQMNGPTGPTFHQTARPLCIRCLRRPHCYMLAPLAHEAYSAKTFLRLWNDFAERVPSVACGLPLRRCRPWPLPATCLPSRALRPGRIGP